MSADYEHDYADLEPTADEESWDSERTDDVGRDVVAMDDFIYGEPTP